MICFSLIALSAASIGSTGPSNGWTDQLNGSAEALIGCQQLLNRFLWCSVKIVVELKSQTSISLQRCCTFNIYLNLSEKFPARGWRLGKWAIIHTPHPHDEHKRALTGYAWESVESTVATIGGYWGAACARPITSRKVIGRDCVTAQIYQEHSM